jgi:disulfide oxidoreductase YuzD
MSKNKINPDDFSIAKKHKDFKKAVILRGNLTNEFTLEDVEIHQRQLDKNERELIAQIKLTTAVVENVERNHEFVAAMSDEQLNVAAYLAENRNLLSEAKKKLKEVEKTKKNYEAVTAAIYEKFGFVESNIIENETAE